MTETQTKPCKTCNGMMKKKFHLGTWKIFWECQDCGVIEECH